MNVITRRIVGLVVATPLEAKIVREALGELHFQTDCDGFTVQSYYLGNTAIRLIECGVGELNAAAATQLLISRYKHPPVELIVNFGTCGSLTTSHVVGKTLLVSGSVHYDFDLSSVDGIEPARHYECESIYIPADKDLTKEAAESELECVFCASGDKFITDQVLKQNLFERYGASICDMESAGVLLTANRAKIPALVFKTVSDGGDPAEYISCMDEAIRNGVNTFLPILEKLIERRT